ncbi:MAG: ribonuclease P protein component [Acidobacteriota bacterium]|nr:ribonuclease P protein component [Acidobacteriota bacterium]
MDEGLSPQERIRKKSDFLALYKKGSRLRGKYFDIVYLANQLPFSRMAVVVSKRVGNAVVRNKVKRWTRDLFRRNKDLMREPTDLILIMRKDIVDLSREERKAEYLSAIRRIARRRPIP